MKNYGLNLELKRKFLIPLLLFLVSTGFVFAQDRTIRGQVTSMSDDSPIPGANVLILGTTSGTVTDLEGNYSLNANDSDVLSFSFVGYNTQEVPVSSISGDTYNVSLSEDMTSLSEVVVIGYGTQDREDLTGSIGSVTAEEISKIPVASVEQAMQGRVAGVQITQNDGRPGGGVAVQIRGIGTFGNNNPLYVVDGFPIRGGIDNLNPSDIASIDILKDASAVAIYGSRAANGVVIITTKRGRTGETRVTIDSYVGLQTEPEHFNVLNAQQFATFANEVGTMEGVPVRPEWSDPESLNSIDWQDELFRNAMIQSHNIGITGGSDKTQAALSLGYFDQDGIVLGSSFKRFNASLNVDHQITDRIKVGTSIRFSRKSDENRFGGGVSGLGILAELMPTMTGNPLTDQIKDEDGNYGYYPPGEISGFNASNPIETIETVDLDNGNNQFIATTFLEVEVIDGLKLRTNFGYDMRTYSGYSFYPTLERHIPGLGREIAEFYQSTNTAEDWLWENTLSYNKTFGAHSIDFVAGVSAQEETYKFLNGAGRGYQSNSLRSLRGAETVTADGSQNINSLSSQFGRLTYKLLDRYIITGTVRRDGSSNFAPGNQYGVFPSVAAAWRLSDEAFMSGQNFVSNLKIRGGWGEVGNQNITPFGYLNVFTGGTVVQDAGYPFGASGGEQGTIVPGLAPVGLPNPDLTWETTRQSNIGLDVAFVEGKVNLTVDYFRKESEDFLIDAIPIPRTSGFPNARRNAGSIVNKGLELALGYQHAEGDFQWSVNANLTTVNNEITSLAPGLDNLPNYSAIGLPTFGGTGWASFSRSEVGGEVGAFYGFVTDGIFQTQEEVDALRTDEGDPYQFTGTSAGDRKFKDINGDGVITDEDRTIIGSPIPDFFYGLTFNASYKNFDLSVFFNGSQGNDILNYQKQNLEAIGVTAGSLGFSNVSVEYANNRWRGEGTSDTYSRAVIRDVNGNSRVSDYFVEDGSFVRLRNVQLGYTLPQGFTDIISLQRARIYIAGTNLLTFTKYSGWDPEIGNNTSSDRSGYNDVTANGVDTGMYPVARTFTAGINLQF